MIKIVYIVPLVLALVGIVGAQQAHADDSSSIYWYNRGYAEGNNKLPMSSTNVNYTQGYKAAIDDLPRFGNLGKIPPHNHKDFYLGIQGGVRFADLIVGNQIYPYKEICPTNHTKEYCIGWHFGDAWEMNARDGM